VSEQAYTQWRVCIRDERGAAVGGGVVLGDRHVLTCAHVVTAAVGGPSAPVPVDFVALRPGLAPQRARVVPDGWFPPLADDSGDLALLELDTPLARGTGPLLRRLSLGAHHRVRLCGFPREAPTGLWVDARMAGECGPGGEWIQLTAAGSDPQVQGGFSGTPVFHEASGAVVGIAVTRLARAGSPVSWMVPVETILSYLPRTRDWVSGDSGVDGAFQALPDTSRADPALVERLTRFFGRGAAGGVMILVVEPGSSALDTLRDIVARSSRERRPIDSRSSADDFPARPDPLLGSIDLALDVSGKTTAEVSGRISMWMNASGVPAETLVNSLAGRPPPMNAVLDGIDAAADPHQLVDEVVEPLTARAAEQDRRLLLTFRDSSSPVLYQAALRLLTARIDQVRDAEHAARDRYQHVEARIAGVPQPAFKASSLLLRLTVLSAAADQPGTAPLLPALESCQRDADRALDGALRARRRLDERLDARNRLRDRLDGYRARSVDHGLTEDTELAEIYRQARELLWSGRCDLARAADLVDRYAALIRRRLDVRGPHEAGSDRPNGAARP
jgi:hypothetical protein